MHAAQTQFDIRAIQSSWAAFESMVLSALHQALQCARKLGETQLLMAETVQNCARNEDAFKFLQL
jgi:hypothetical protein